MKDLPTFLTSSAPAPSLINEHIFIPHRNSSTPLPSPPPHLDITTIPVLTIKTNISTMYTTTIFNFLLFAVLTALAVECRPAPALDSLEGLSNRIRTGAVAIANPAHPKDSRIQRITSKDGEIVRVQNEGGPQNEEEGQYE
ncbi:hypothetical protein DFP73DRAFT_632188 [Morchella snyderi]|nr:hypothetical protein DFP73DRAFT_632188 [Morchella snyderi]